MFWSQHLGCWGQNTSRIQNKGVYATLCLQASHASAPHRTRFSKSNSAPLFFKMACKQNLDLRCVLISDPSTLGAGAKTRLESRIKKFTPHCIYRYTPPSSKKGFAGNENAHLTNYSLNKYSDTFKHANESAFSVDNTASKRLISTVLKQLKTRSRPAASQGTRDHAEAEAEAEAEAHARTSASAQLPADATDATDTDPRPVFDEALFWKRVEDCTAAIITAMLPMLRQSYGRHFKQTSPELREKPCQAFHILGIDVMLRDDYSLVLLEVNNAPSMNLTQVVPIPRDKLPSVFRGRRKVGEERPKGAPPRGAPCNCSDYSDTHYHEVSVVDEHCKTIAVGGSLELLQKLSPASQQQATDLLRKRLLSSKQEESLIKTHFFLVGDEGQERLRDVLRMIELLYSRFGGVKKAFNATTMRRELAKVQAFIGKKLTTSDVDMICGKFRDISKAVHNQHDKGREEGLHGDFAVLDFGIMLTKFVYKRYGDTLPPGPNNTLLALLYKLLKNMGALAESKPDTTYKVLIPHVRASITSSMALSSKKG